MVFEEQGGILMPAVCDARRAHVVRRLRERSSQGCDHRSAESSHGQTGSREATGGTLSGEEGCYGWLFLFQIRISGKTKVCVKVSNRNVPLGNSRG